MYKTHVDAGALDCLVEQYDIRSMLDVGCGPGGMVVIATDAGIRAVGVDGDWKLSDQVQAMARRRRGHMEFVLHDYTTGPIDLGPFDLGWCVEFLEHIEQQYLDNVFASLRACRVVFCTHAIPIESSTGHHHVNVRPEAWWISEFERRGFRYDEPVTMAVRTASTMRCDFTRRTGKVFLRG